MTAHGDEHGEQGDPFHIRPYVSLPEDGGTGAAAGAAGAAASDAAVGADRADAAVGTHGTFYEVPGAEDGTTVLPDLSPFARQGTAETAELPVVSREAHEARQARKAARTASEGSGAAPRSHRRAKGGSGGRGGRRRPTTGILAAAGVAAALGAGLLTTQALTGDRGGEDGSSAEDRALEQRPTGAPTHGIASDPASPSPSEKSAKPSKSPSSLPSRTSASVAPRVDRDDDAHTERETTPSPSASSRKSDKADASPSERRRERAPERRREQRPEQPGGSTLNVGSSGPAVADLQRRLKQVGYLSPDTEEDGVYSSTVQEGVYRYQVTYGIDEDEPGAYGPYTRRSLESRT